MSYNQVKELRQSGHLDEALSMAMEELNAEPDNVWNKRSLFWVLYEFLKKTAEDGDSSAVFETLDKIGEIGLVNMPGEEMTRTNLFRCIKALLRKKATIRNNQPEIEQLANRLCAYSWNIVLTSQALKSPIRLDGASQMRSG